MGLDRLLEQVEEILAAELIGITVRVPYARGDLAALFHNQGTVVNVVHEEDGTILEGHVPRRWREQFRPFEI